MKNYRNKLFYCRKFFVAKTIFFKSTFLLKLEPHCLPSTVEKFFLIQLVQLRQILVTQTIENIDHDQVIWIRDRHAIAQPEGRLIEHSPSLSALPYVVPNRDPVDGKLFQTVGILIELLDQIFVPGVVLELSFVVDQDVVVAHPGVFEPAASRLPQLVDAPIKIIFVLRAFENRFQDARVQWIILRVKLSDVLDHDLPRVRLGVKDVQHVPTARVERIYVGAFKQKGHYLPRSHVPRGVRKVLQHAL